MFSICYFVTRWFSSFFPHFHVVGVLFYTAVIKTRSRKNVSNKNSVSVQFGSVLFCSPWMMAQRIGSLLLGYIYGGYGGYIGGYSYDCVLV